VVYRISPSILATDFARLGEEVRPVIDAGADWICFDLTDNQCVPSLSIVPATAAAVKPPYRRPDGHRFR
jgi:ribulose-phosphate 3-epimerase